MEPVYFATRAEFRAWLTRHGASQRELLVRFYKKATGKGGLTYKEAVDESLCFGWIDGVRRTLDESSFSQRFTPRTKRSNWSDVNIKRYRELEADGRVAPAGRAAFEARPAAGGAYSFEQANLELAPAHVERFKGDPEAWQYWSKCPPSYKRIGTWWVVSARRQETRDKRFAELLECSRQGLRIPLVRRREPTG